MLKLGTEFKEVIKEELINNDFSTSEKIIGKWVNGKDIYRKVIFNGIPASQVTYLSHSTPITQLINVYGAYRRPSVGYWNTLPGNYTNWEAFIYDVSTSSATLRFSNNQWNSGIDLCYVVIEYTK